MMFSTKVCTKCGEEKGLGEFHKDSSKKDGRKPSCKSCVKAHHQANRERILEQQREYYRANKERLSEYYREHYQANKGRILEQQREYYQANMERISEYKREYHQANKERLSEHYREYHQANRERRLEYNREHYQANKEYYREYKKERYASDPLYALKERCSARIRHALNGHGFSKTATTKDMLGCSYEELMRHIESQFVEGMTWDNRSDWHIDHIVPLASAESDEELLVLCHYTNLQPLWAEDNIRKGATHE